MSERIDIYNFPLRIAQAEKRIMDSPSISDFNKIKIREYIKHCYVKGLTTCRIIKHIQHLQRIIIWLDKDVSEITSDNITDLLIKINQTDYSEWTKKDYRIITRIFLKWVGKDKECDIIRVGHGPRQMKIPEELLTEHELLNMLNIADNKRDRALITCLYESGGRIGEIAGLRIKHIQFDRYGAVITVDGKTGMRPISVIFSAPYLEDWLASHPLRDDMNAPVWICQRGNNKGTKQLNYPAIAKMLKDLGKKAGVKKRIHPHLFRHSRATFLANHLTELQMDEYLGWVPGSGMPRTYVHLTQKNVKKALLELYGLSFKDNDKPLLVPVVCTGCGKINGPTFDSCIRCGSNLHGGDSVLPVRSAGAHQEDRNNKILSCCPD